MKIETEDYKLFERRLLELGIEKIDFVEPDFLRNFEIHDVSIFNESQLQTLLGIVEEKGIELGNCFIYCITLDNLEEQINKIKLLQETLQNSRILIGGELSDKVIIERITVYDNGKEESELGTNLYEPYVSIEDLTYICQTIQKDDFEKNEVLQVKTKFYAGTGEEEKTFERGILLIDNITQLSKEDALRIKESGKIKYVAVKNSNGPDKYDISTYIRILEAFQEITGDIDKSLSDEKKFEIVYRRICESIQYGDIIENPETEDEKNTRKLV